MKKQTENNNLINTNGKYIGTPNEDITVYNSYVLEIKKAFDELDTIELSDVSHLLLSC